jgi:hypothetical protein
LLTNAEFSNWGWLGGYEAVTCPIVPVMGIVRSYDRAFPFCEIRSDDCRIGQFQMLCLRSLSDLSRVIVSFLVAQMKWIEYLRILTLTQQERERHLAPEGRQAAVPAPKVRSSQFHGLCTLSSSSPPRQGQVRASLATLMHTPSQPHAPFLAPCHISS